MFLIRYKPNRGKSTVWQKVISHLRHPQYFLNHLPIGTEKKRSARVEQILKTENDGKNPLRKFEQFRAEHLKMSEKVYTSYAELHADPPAADAYITGSDQVWHDSYAESPASGWFLQFGSDGGQYRARAL